MSSSRTRDISHSQVLIHLFTIISIVIINTQFTNGQLPDDIQRELNQNLAEQAKIQALRQQQQRSQGSSSGNGHNHNQAQPKHDPNNYSYQQVSPPIQYSYYQPYGDAAAPSQQAPVGPTQRQQQQQQQPINFDFNNLNLNDLPQPQPQVSSVEAQPRQHHFTPSFTGAGGLPVLKPIANSGSQYVPNGQAPLAPQARVQQAPPLSEADFKDITGGENYGAGGGSDFGLGDAASSNQGSPRGPTRRDDTDAQLREFGMPAEPAQVDRRGNQGSNPMEAQQMNIPDFGAFNPIGGAQTQGQPKQRSGGDMSDGFGTNFDNLAGAGEAQAPNSPSGGDSEFDFAGQPSSQRNDQTASGAAGGAPGSLQSLLGASFPGLGGGGMNDLTGGGGANSRQRSGSSPSNQGSDPRLDSGALDIADMGDKSDQFSGADLGGFEQPSPQNDQDFNLAASNQQPKSVPYPDSNPQPVGTLWALTQPQSLTQTRYNALPDKGTYQDYPGYQHGGNDFEAVREVVDSTPRSRAPGPGRYGAPSQFALAPEHRENLGPRQQFDYNSSPI